MEEYLKEERITQQNTAGYSPQSNGASERMNRTIKNDHACYSPEEVHFGKILGLCCALCRTCVQHPKDCQTQGL